ncbi:MULTISPECIES: lysine N(6)-hydroxylase/L-ornithine N(5)-oxygenase family protein [unclassified Streptomyces]|uniref:lysine N(6)-hydroxylase/L-ornithine N(5)-oxygenase family protein n=1 Tax=unclassified Streptomyces TaxID=2593676 RepID=UPI00344D9BC6
MGTSDIETYDLVGVGFGPSNLSLAVALEEHRENTPGQPLKAAFFERQPSFGWHRNMLLPNTTMQISFLKDLATFRNPVSRYSFVSYLHAAGRLTQFVNNKEFFPTRQEFHQYLEWVESNFSHQVSYSSEVTALRLPEGNGTVTPDYVQVEVRDTTGSGSRLVNARNLVISTGLVPRMPDGIQRDERVWHSSEFLERFRAMNGDDLKNVAVVGAGQSAAEIARFFHDTLPHAQVTAVIPSYGYSVADDTPFANQVFDPSAVDDYYFGTELTREAFWRYHKNTNYSVVDDELIRDLHKRSYQEDVSGSKRLRFLNLTRVAAVRRAGTETRVTLRSLIEGESRELETDVLVFATGYDSMEPGRLLGDLGRHFQLDGEGLHRVERNYRIATAGTLPFDVYLQGGTEHTHGLTSSLLSNLAIRSGEIVESVVRRRAQRELTRRTPVTAGESAG